MRKPRSVHSCRPSKSVSCPRSSLRIQETSRALTTNQPSPSATSPASVFFSSASGTEDVGADLRSSATRSSSGGWVRWYPHTTKHDCPQPGEVEVARLQLDLVGGASAHELEAWS